MTQNQKPIGKKGKIESEIDRAYHKGFYEGTLIANPSETTLKAEYKRGYKDCMKDYKIKGNKWD